MAQNSQTLQTAPTRKTRNTATHDSILYESEVTTATLGGREIRVEHLTPILSPEERDARKREIESRLFNVFIKYVGKP